MIRAMTILVLICALAWSALQSCTEECEGEEKTCDDGKLYACIDGEWDVQVDCVNNIHGDYVCCETTAGADCLHVEECVR